MRYGENLTNPDFCSKKVYGGYYSNGEKFIYGRQASPRVLYPTNNVFVNDELVKVTGMSFEPSLRKTTTYANIYLSANVDQRYGKCYIQGTTFISLNNLGNGTIDSDFIRYTIVVNIDGVEYKGTIIERTSNKNFVVSWGGLEPGNLGTSIYDFRLFDIGNPIGDPINFAPIKVSGYASDNDVYEYVGYFDGYFDGYGQQYDILDNGTWFYDFDVTSGFYTFYVQTYNSFDNVKSKVVEFKFKKDAFSPNLTIQRTATNDQVIEGRVFEDKTFASDIDSVIAINETADSNKIFYASLINDPTTEKSIFYLWTVLVDNMVLGEYNTIKIIATDKAGNTTELVTEILYENIAPLVEVTTPYINSKTIRGTFTNLKGGLNYASDIDNITVNGYKVPTSKILITGQDINENDIGIWYHTFDKIFGENIGRLEDGVYKTIVTITDKAKNVYSTYYDITMDTTKPFGEIDISDLILYNGSYYTNKDLIKGSFKASGCAPLTRVRLTIKYADNTITELDLLTIDGHSIDYFYDGYGETGVWLDRFHFENRGLLKDGLNRIILTIVNAAGTTTTIKKTFIYDTQRPALVHVFINNINEIELYFDEIINIETASDLKAYNIKPINIILKTGILTTGNENSLTIINAKVNQKNVILTTKEFLYPGQDYQVICRGVKDLAGNAIL